MDWRIHLHRNDCMMFPGNGMPRIPLGEPVQLMTGPGDVVLCRYGLARTAAVKLSAFDRYALYFRLWLKDIEQRRWHLMTLVWDGWERAGRSPT